MRTFFFNVDRFVFRSPCHIGGLFFRYSSSVSTVDTVLLLDDSGDPVSLDMFMAGSSSQARRAGTPSGTDQAGTPSQTPQAGTSSQDRAKTSNQQQADFV